ncbi:MAG: WecB/TagA/CpsF family glycosyltransferase [Patescibacteria group bacterium]|nr:WecB/TagA/CpsF family glycosyltransferase [Patescibacteria group bacterium]MBU2509605.1 WecB/TagA/CpsF family glycosyltransferase [Patescibacteria group bacterium]
MSTRSTFDCFGLVIHGFDWPQIKARIDDARSYGRKIWIVTANPEILLHAKRDPAYWQTIRHADLRTVDGMGLQILGWFLHSNPKRLSGVDLSEKLLERAVNENWKVAFVGGDKGVADKAAWKMRKCFPDLKISAHEGGKIDEHGIGDSESKQTEERLKVESNDLIFVALGHPKQEAWIERHLEELPNLKVIVGVGGTFDYWACTVKRAPIIVQKLGFEWLWRLILQPKRWKRIFNAVIIFPITAILDRSSNKKQ